MCITAIINHVFTNTCLCRLIIFRWTFHFPAERFVCFPVTLFLFPYNDESAIHVSLLRHLPRSFFPNVFQKNRNESCRVLHDTPVKAGFYVIATIAGKNVQPSLRSYRNNSSAIVAIVEIVATTIVEIGLSSLSTTVGIVAITWKPFSWNYSQQSLRWLVLVLSAISF